MAKDAQKVLDGLVAGVKKSFEEDRTILSFREYFDLVMAEPERQLRSSSQYIVDMLDHWGRDELELPTGKAIRFRLFDAPFANGEGRVAGQERVQEQLYRTLANFAREGKVNRLVLLHGPNGSAKSSLVRCLMNAMEAYARTAEGAMYSFNWIFPSSKLEGSSIGFGSKRGAEVADTFAYLTADSIDARVPCEMHDHPLFLVPQSQRGPLLAELLPEKGNKQTSGIQRPIVSPSDYLRNGDLCYKCRKIYDALLASYDGDATKVLAHIQVERFYISRRYRRGAATIEPQMSVDARIHQVTADRSLASLPKALQHVSLYEPAGPLVDANRGLLEYSDLLKRPVEAFKYLLATVETATVSMESFVLHLDMVYLASTNEVYLDAFKEHPDFPSFKGRMELIKVPYLVRYGSEQEIYATQITSRIVGRHVAPHAIDVAALWAVLTRMRKCDPSRYPKDLHDIIEQLSPLEKLRLYDKGTVPDRLTSREAKELRHETQALFEESLSYPNYEGRFGASAREVRMALLNAAHHPEFKCLTPLAVFDELEEILASKSIYEFLRQDVVGKYHDHRAFLDATKELYATWIDDEIRAATGLAAEESYLDLFVRYVAHVSHWVKREKMVDPASGDLRDPDQAFMSEIEGVLVQKSERAEDFRRAIIGAIGARSLENPNQKPNYAELFHGHIQHLRENFYEKKKSVLRKINENFLHFTAGESQGLDAKQVADLQKMLERLETKHGYCMNCARDTVAYLLKTRYAD